MLCHLYYVVDLCILGVVVSFSRFSCGRFVDSSVSPSVFLDVLVWCMDRLVTYLVVLCFRLNSICLLRFIMVVLLFS
jgi:hypothetical protein